MQFCIIFIIYVIFVFKMKTFSYFLLPVLFAFLDDIEVPKKGLFLRKEFAPFGANSFLEE